LAIIPPLLDLIFTIGAPHRERRGNAGQHTGGKLTPLHRLDNLLSLESRRIISGSERRAGGSGVCRWKSSAVRFLWVLFPVLEQLPDVFELFHGIILKRRNHEGRQMDALAGHLVLTAGGGIVRTPSAEDMRTHSSRHDCLLVGFKMMSRLRGKEPVFQIASR
jgi:hypothetical protein